MAKKARDHLWNFSGQIGAALIGAFAAIAVAVIAIILAGNPLEKGTQPPQAPITNTLDVADKSAPAPAVPPPNTQPARASRTANPSPQPVDRARERVARAAPVATAPPQTIIKQACVVDNSVIEAPTTQDCTGVTQ